MSYNILGINTSHNGSVCILKDGKIYFFLEEERLSNFKTDELPIKTLEFVSENYTIDEIAIGGLTQRLSHRPLVKSYLLNLNLLFPKVNIHNFLDHHHLTHILSSFYNSKFKQCLGVTIDGNGSYIEDKDGKTKVETESIFVLDNIKDPYCIYKSNRLLDFKKDPKEVSPEGVSLTKVYECITESLGFGNLEPGKTMGLSSYGRPNPNIPPLYIGSKGNKKIIDSNFKGAHGSLRKEYHYLLDSWDLSQDLAFKVQQESQQAVGDLIEKFIRQTGIKQVCCAGGYFLNCVANYYLAKRFPDVEFYFEPISSDAGVSIGAAQLLYHLQKPKDTTVHPQKTLYYGPKYSKKQLLNGIQKYL